MPSTSQDGNNFERVHAELTDLFTVLTELTQLPSNWNGTLYLTPNPGFKGQKPFTCEIILDDALASEDVRWRTWLHEALHALSQGYNRMDFGEFRGWEEGVVEKMQRLLRPVVLKRLGVNVEESVFLPADQRHLYNHYVAALEELQQWLNVPEFEFYARLLGTPIKNRASSIGNVSSVMTGEERKAFLLVFSRCNAILKGGQQWNSLNPKNSIGNGSSA